MTYDQTPSPIQKLEDPLFTEAKIELFVKRDDLLVPEIMGNKWRKLKYNLKRAAEERKSVLVSYGGAYSNHISALAAAGRNFDFKTIGIIRGDELSADSNPTLSKAKADGMKLVFVDRSAFREYKEQLKAPFELSKDHYILPEGGTNDLAVKGAEEILTEQETGLYDYICTAMGTGGTFCGLARQVKKHQLLIGISALKGKWLEKDIAAKLQIYNVPKLNYLVAEDRFFGGYGKYNEELIQFILLFRQNFGILLDPVYTGKLFFSVWEMVKERQFRAGSKILMIHTGGLQGIDGFNSRYDLNLPTL
jgi:1-aminocyclopropane-1-carboxylate deaminase/D-cysteine desulfhydrase-like pyridoxal-dependent ACC family enzyme